MIGMKKLSYIILIIIIGLSLSCSDKKSPFGYSQDYQIRTDTLFNVIDIVESYADTIYNYSENTTLAVGDYHYTETKTVFRYLTLPDTTWLDSVSIDSCVVSMVKKGSNGDDQMFALEEITTQWLENTVTWDSLANSWGAEIVTNFNYVADTLYFELPTTLVEYWIENDTINYGFGMYSNNPDSIFTEFYSSESGYEPELTIYSTGESGKNDTLVYIPSKDALLAKNTNTSNFNYGLISNLPPRRTVLRIDRDSVVNYLVQNDSISTDDISRISINRAEVIFDTVLIYDSYLGSGNLTFYPYYIVDTTNYDSYGSISGREKSYYTGSGNMSFVISGIFQAQLRDLLETNMFFMSSLYESKDYSYVRFSQQAGNIRPKLKIIFTISNQE